MVVYFLSVIFLLNAELAWGTCLAGPVVHALFLEGTGLVVLQLVLFWGIYTMGACLEGTSIFELHFDLVCLLQDVIV